MSHGNIDDHDSVPDGNAHDIPTMSYLQKVDSSFITAETFIAAKVHHKIWGLWSSPRKYRASPTYKVSLLVIPGISQKEPGLQDRIWVQ